MGIPKDDDNDRLADKWERQQKEAWNLQYSTNEPIDLSPLPDDDNELADPDGTGPQPMQKAAGDAHSTLEEYRGYILDGGGFDAAGGNGHPGGHKRLSIARKEVLLEVDRNATLNNLPAGGLPAVLDGTSKFYSEKTEIYVYYAIETDAHTINAADVAAHAKQKDNFEATREFILSSDFIHVLFIDSGLMELESKAPALVWDRSQTQNANQRGIIFGTSDLFNACPPILYPKRLDLYITALAHEITHTIILPARNQGIWDQGEHIRYNRPTCLMFNISNWRNRDLGIVDFFDEVKAELNTKDGEGIAG